MKNCLDAVFKKGFNKASNYLENLAFKALTQTLLSKVKGPALAKERWRKGSVFFSTPKVGAHNSVPSRQLYY